MTGGVRAPQRLQGCTEQIDPSRVEGIAISNQRETLAFVDANGESLHPAIIWLDERARSEVQIIQRKFWCRANSPYHRSPSRYHTLSLPLLMDERASPRRV